MLLIDRAVDFPEKASANFFLFAVLDSLKEQVFEGDTIEELAEKS